MRSTVERGLTKIQKHLGPRGLEQLLDDLSGPENNWQLAHQYQISVVTISFLRQNFGMVYNAILESKRSKLRLVYSRTDTTQNAA